MASFALDFQFAVDGVFAIDFGRTLAPAAAIVGDISVDECTVVAAVSQPVEISAEVPLDEVLITAALAYDAAVFRGLVCRAVGQWSDGSQAVQGTAARWQRPTGHVMQKVPSWRVGVVVCGFSNAAWSSPLVVPVASAAVFAASTSAPRALAAPWRYPARNRRAVSPAWGHAQVARGAAGSAWRAPPLAPVTAVVDWRPGIAAARIAAAGYRHPSRVAARAVRLPWRAGVLPAALWPWPTWPRPGAVVPAEPLPTHFALRFCCPGGDVVGAPFVIPIGRVCVCPDDAGLVIPVRRVYYMLHEASVVRLPGREPIEVMSLRMSADRSSYCWSIQGRAHVTQRALLEASGAEPTEIEVTVNGTAWRFVVESVPISRAFGSTTVTFAGRGLACYLSSQYAPTHTHTEAAAKTAQQLGNDELDLTGWALDWQLDDWLVPGGVWSYTGLAPIDALGRIVGAAGGYLHGHRAAKTLHALPAFPALPWDLAAATPDITVPEAAVRALSSTPASTPLVNAVYVSGERAGVTALVRRYGTAGDDMAEMIIDALCTHDTAARQRGGGVLAASGRRASVEIELPPIAPVGFIEVGQVARVIGPDDDWRGYVRSVAIDVQRRADRGKAVLTVSQTAGIDRHFE